MTPEDPDENTPLPQIANVIPIHKQFVIDTNDRLTFTEKRLYNIEDSINHITQIEFPRINGKLDRLLDGQREQNKHLMNKPKIKLSYVWASIGLVYMLVGYLLFR